MGSPDRAQSEGLLHKNLNQIKEIKPLHFAVQCQTAGCGEWKRPKIRNPAFKGKWYPPKIKNPAYKGPWSARKVILHPTKAFKLAWV